MSVRVAKHFCKRNPNFQPHGHTRKVRGSHPNHSQRLAIGTLKRFGVAEVTPTHLRVSHSDLGCFGVFFC